MRILGNPACSGSSAVDLLGKAVLVERSHVSPDRSGCYRGEIVVAENSRDFSVRLLFADGAIARQFDIGWAGREERILFGWDGWYREGVIAPQILRIVTPGLRGGTLFVWTTIVAVRTDGPTGAPVFFTALGPLGSDAIVRIGH